MIFEIVISERADFELLWTTSMNKTHSDSQFLKDALEGMEK